MKKLKNLLSDDLKVLRHRRLILNIQITTLTWLFELVISFLAIFIKIVGVDIKNKAFSFLAPELIIFVYTVLFPVITLINDTKIKDNIIESDWYISILGKMGWTYRGPTREEIHTDKTEPAQRNALSDLEGNKTELNVEDKDTVEIDGRNSNTLSINSKVRSIPNNEINEKSVLRKSNHSKDCEITDLEV